MYEVLKCQDDLRAKILKDPDCKESDFNKKCEMVDATRCNSGQECNPSLVDPKCAKPDSINTWLANKSVQLRVLNDKVDFSVGKNEIR